MKYTHREKGKRVSCDQIPDLYDDAPVLLMMLLLFLAAGSSLITLVILSLTSFSVYIPLHGTE
jgi:hypothetical protein